MFNETVKAAAACEMTQVEMPNLRSWRNRYGLEVGTDDGQPRYSLRDVLAIALHKNLVGANVPPMVAARFACDSADKIVDRPDKMMEEADAAEYDLLAQPRYLKCFYDDYRDQFTPEGEQPDWYCVIETVPHLRGHIESFIVVVVSLVVRRIVNAWRAEFATRNANT